jgi:hypothetical protein
VGRYYDYTKKKGLIPEEDRVVDRIDDDRLRFIDRAGKHIL